MFLSYAKFWREKVAILVLFCLLTFLFCTVWLGKTIKHLVRCIRFYRMTKNKDFRDLRERDRILYNYETHIVKDIILIFLCLCEFLEPLFALMCSFQFVFSGLLLIDDSNNVDIAIMNTKAFKCTVLNTLETFNDLFQTTLIDHFFQPYLFLVKAIGCIAFLKVLSFLTIYLAKRYFFHSITKTLYWHVFSFFTQSGIVAILCNRDTIILHFLIIPVLILMDWCILLKHCIILRRVLTSNLKDLDLHFSNRYLYREQFKVLHIYKVFMPIILASLLFGTLAVLSHYYLLFISVFLSSQCNFIPVSSEFMGNFDGLLNLVYFGLIFLHIFLIGLPFYIATTEVICRAFYLRFLKKNIFRYNYRNLQAELRRFNIHPPY